MLKRLLYTSLLVGIAGGLPAWGQPAGATRVGTLSHIAAGGAWDTTITLINASSSQVDATLIFHADDGSSLSLPLSVTQNGGTQSGTTAMVERGLSPNSTLIVNTGPQLANTVVGWAEVIATGPVSGFAIFRTKCATCTPAEGTVPLQAQFQSTLIVPYDNTSNYVTGVALANLGTAQATIAATIWDEYGNRLGAPTITIPASGHTAFTMPAGLSATTGNRGIVQFQNLSGGALDGIGLRFSPFGTFTSVPVILPATGPLPQITYLNPTSGQAGTNVALTINGSNLSGVTGLQFSPSTGITVSNVNATATQVTATVTIASNAANGQRNVSVYSPAGSSNTLTFTIQAAPAPQLTSLNPTSGQAGTNVALTIYGSNLSGVTGIQFSGSTGITANYLNATATQVTATVSIPSSATAGQVNVSVSSPTGSSNTLTFSIQAAPAPIITTLSPNSGQAGYSSTLVIYGSNLSGVTAIQFSPSTGITVSNLNASATQVTASVSIASNASTGQRNVYVSSPTGSSNTLAFTINGGGTYDGQWTGTTSQGKAMSMTIANGVVTPFTYGVNLSLPYGCPTGITTTVYSSATISSGSFSSSAGGYSGSFQGSTQASGTLHWSISLSGCNGSGDLTWSATKQ